MIIHLLYHDMGLVRFELTIDGSLRKRQVFGDLSPDQTPYLNTGSSKGSSTFSAPTVPHSLPRPVRSVDLLLIITPRNAPS